MACPSPENSSADRKRAVDGLILGRNLTCQLREMLKNTFDRDGHGPPPSKVVAEDLVAKILESFNEGISLLGSMDSDEVSQAAQPGSPPCDGRKSEDSSGSCKTSALKDGRGCYKRR